jgi:arginyl-tRNA synthetase
MIRETLHQLVARAIQAAQAAGDLPAFDPPAFGIDHPRQANAGDYAASVALQLARQAKLPPPAIAQAIARHLGDTSAVCSVEVSGAYLNFRLTPAFLSAEVERILAAGQDWGRVDAGAGRSAQVEHGSANPTGPLTVASARNVVIGDTLANVLAAAGYRVQREWYVNDAGNQIRHFGASLYARYAQALGRDEPFPEDGYRGEYVADIARDIIARDGNRYLDLPKDEARRALGKLGIDAVMDGVRASLARVGITYDRFFSERSLYESGLFERVLPILRDKGLLVEHDGALWFSEDGSPIRKAEGGKRKAEEAEPSPEPKTQNAPVQAVVIRSPQVIADPSERPTYFASDIAYVWDKLVERGFDRAVYVWGEDHQGDVPRVLAAARALGLDPARVTLLIYRFITLLRGGQEVRMGKRAGNIVTLDDMVDEAGPDATRFVLLSRSIDTKIVFDLDLVKKQSDDNPVYYVQYAHARICSILRKADETRDWRLEIRDSADAPISNLQSPISSLQSPISSLQSPISDLQSPPYDLRHPSELALARKLLELPEVVELVATALQPHHLAAYAQSLAAAFSAFYRDCRIIGEAPEVFAARMKLAQASKLTLARTLGLMGMAAPERM